MAKAISWRITGTLDTTLVSLVITQSLKFAAAIGFTEVVTKSLLYYLHERAWLKIPFGRVTPDKGTVRNEKGPDARYPRREPQGIASARKD